MESPSRRRGEMNEIELDRVVDYFDALPWKKAIIVFIGMPDEEVLNG